MSDAFIRIRGLTKSFGSRLVLDHIDLDIPKGNVTCIIGPSGGGKSTLLRCLNLLELPDEGEVQIGEHRHVGGQRIPEEELRALRARTGMVFQSFELFGHLNVLQNVTLAQRRVLGRSKDDADQRAHELLGQVGLADRASARVHELSGGQKQRVAIARALALDPDVLLFDEATSALDPELSADVLGVIRALATEGRTMVVVTHEVGFAREVADDLVVIADGHLFHADTLRRGEGADRPGYERALAYVERVLTSS
ncbi:MAG: amino acid ABC transporter ATP-binding protein [Actinomycetaceae bacterium]|nr:amino acid ABC transporter ATP-binding protein [Actinomycetaceae bacterium]